MTHWWILGSRGKCTHFIIVHVNLPYFFLRVSPFIFWSPSSKPQPPWYCTSTISQHENRNLRIVYESWYISEITNYVFPHHWLIYPRVQLRKGFWNNLDYFRNVSSMRKHFKQNISAIFPHASITEIHYSFPSPLRTNSVQVTNADISVCLGHISVCCLHLKSSVSDNTLYSWI